MVYLKSYSIKQCCLIFLLFFVILLKPGKSERLMRAAVINSIGKHSMFQVINLLVPNITEDQVLIKVKAASVNPVDVYIRMGSYPIEPNFPIILGKEVSGTIEEIGSSVTNFKIDDKVFCGIEQGGYAEYAVSNASSCFPLPKRLSFSQGSAIFISYFTAYRGIILKGNLTKDGSLLVHGTNGNLGVPAIHIAKYLGAYAVATIGSPAYYQIVKDAGADYIVYHNTYGYLDDAVSTTSLQGFDVILETVRHGNIKQDKHYLLTSGIIIVLGGYASIAVKNQYLRPGKKAADSVSLFEYKEEDMKEAANFVLKAIEDGSITPVVDKEFLLENINFAHRAVGYHGAKGKIVLVF